MEQNELEKKYKELLTDDRYDKLLLNLKDPNIFRILGVSDYEIRHSNFLAWLLDPHESHGLGEMFLQRVLQDIFMDIRAEDISILELGGLDQSEVEVRREWKNIDILIITAEFVVCIENKIWSHESKGQLLKYKKIVDENFPNKKRCYVFLSPTGYEASQSEIYIPFSYVRVSDILSEIINSRMNLLNPSAAMYIKDYLSTLKQNVMSDDKTNEWARTLYRNHKELFDFVFQNKPDYWYDFAAILNKKVRDQGWIIGSKNKGYVRFLTPAIQDLILKYKRANGWPNKEAFLFEFDFYVGNRLSFKSTISPAVDYYDYDKRIFQIIGSMEGANAKAAEKWSVHFHETMNWNLEKIMLDWNEKHEKRLDNFIEDIKPLVARIEAELLKHKDELLELKEGIDKE